MARPIPRFSPVHAALAPIARGTFVADSGNYVIRFISPAGEVSTYAGTPGSPGHLNGPAAEAQFGDLRGLAVGSDWTIYVAEYNRIRRISSTGIVSDIAGGGSVFSIQEGESRSALSLSIYGGNAISVDSENNAYAATGLGVLKISPTGIATKLSGIGNTFDISDLDFDPDGNLLIAHNVGGFIAIVSPTGSVTALDPNYDIPFEERYFSGLAALPDGETWITQEYVGGVSKLTDGDEVETIARFNPIPGTPVYFRTPNDITPAPAGGVYLSDSSSHSIQHVSPDGTTVIAGQGAKTGFDGDLGDAVFIQPINISNPGNGLMYVLNNWQIREIDIAANTITSVANREDVSFDLQSFDNWRDFTATANGDFANFPRNCLSRRTASGQRSIIAGVNGESEIRDGTGANARFGSPRSLTTDAAGNLYVADSIDGQTIRRISPAGVVTTIAGSPTAYANEAENNGDGFGTDARFNHISAITATPTGGLWIGEYALLRYMAPSGEVTTLAGTPGQEFPGGPDGQGESVVFNRIQDIVQIDDRTALILETHTNRVRRAPLDGVVATIAFNGRYSIDDQNNSFSALAHQDGRYYLVDQTNRRFLTGMLIEDNGRLANLSVLKRVGDAGEKLTAGLVIAGEVSQPLLIRAVGPTLSNYGVNAGFMPDPEFSVFDRSSTEVDSNNNWTGTAEIVDTMQRLGAFPLETGSTDAALVRAIPNGSTTATVGPADGQAGTVLVEVYYTDLASGSRLTNLSTLTTVGPGDGRLILGFVITGAAVKTVLIRGIGPTLTQFGFSVGDVLRDPRIRLFKGSTRMTENDNWAAAPLLNEAFTTVGAFALSEADSKDAALLVQLGPGAYSVHLQSVDGHTGSAIAEVYEVK